MAVEPGKLSTNGFLIRRSDVSFNAVMFGCYPGSLKLDTITVLDRRADYRDHTKRTRS